MIDLNYKNHNFQLTGGISEYHYFCTKCNVSMWYNYDSTYNFYGLFIDNLKDYKKVKYLTCEEIIIKNIIE